MESPINILIPADELHWNEHEGRYSVVSTEEMDRLIRLCLDAGMDDDDIFKVVQDFGIAKTGHILYKHLLEGDISLGGLDDTGRPIFRRKHGEG